MENKKLLYVVDQLVRRHQEKQLTRIAELTGLHRRTLSRIKDRNNTPTLETLDELHAFLKRTQRKKTL